MHFTMQLPSLLTLADRRRSGLSPRAGPSLASQLLPKATERPPSMLSDDTVAESRNVSLEVVMLESLALEDKLAAVVCIKRAKGDVKVFFWSIKPVVSKSSSFTDREQEAVNGQFKEIGTGSAAKVFEHPGNSWACKLTLLDRYKKLWHNYLMQR